MIAIRKNPSKPINLNERLNKMMYAAFDTPMDEKGFNPRKLRFKIQTKSIYSNFLITVSYKFSPFEYKPVGSVTIAPFGEACTCWKLWSLWVAPRYCQRGIGSQILELVLLYAKKKRIKKITLDAYEKAIPLYEKFGFKIVTEFIGFSSMELIPS